MFLSFYTTRVQFRYLPRPMFRTSCNDHRSKSGKFINVSSWWRNFSNEYGMIWSRAYNWFSRKKNMQEGILWPGSIQGKTIWNQVINAVHMRRRMLHNFSTKMRNHNVSRRWQLRSDVSTQPSIHQNAKIGASDTTTTNRAQPRQIGHNHDFFS